MELRRKILAVDDDPMNLAVTRQVLGDEYELITAASGEAALVLLERDHPDLVLLDVMMPGLDGHETCRRIRASESMRNTMVILVSSNEHTEDRLRGYDAGADDYLIKPFDVDELRAKVRVFLRLKAAEDIDGMKSHMLALLDKEFTAPLTGLIPAGEMLSADREISKVDRRKWGNVVLEGARRLLKVAQRCNLLCGLREGSVVVDRSPVALGRLAVDLLDGAAAEFPGSIKLDVRIDDASTIQADARLLETALRCVLEAAVDHSESGAQLDIQILPAVGGASVLILVERSKMTERQLAILFGSMNTSMCKPGVRTSEDGVVGADIALSLARAIFREHGGNLSVYREGEKGVMLNVTVSRGPVEVESSSVDAVVSTGSRSSM